jgi:hypothetical protein
MSLRAANVGESTNTGVYLTAPCGVAASAAACVVVSDEVVAHRMQFDPHSGTRACVCVCVCVCVRARACAQTGGRAGGRAGGYQRMCVSTNVDVQMAVRAFNVLICVCVREGGSGW